MPKPFQKTAKLQKTLTFSNKNGKLHYSVEALMNTVRYGIIGCGKHAFQSHAAVAQDIRGVELVALCDPSHERMEEFEKAMGGLHIEKFKDEERFLARGLHAVIIASPDEYHANSLLVALEAGLHVFAEKPLAVNSAQLGVLRRALNVARSSGLVFTSCHPRRYDPPFMWLKQNMKDLVDDLGTLLSFRFDFSYHKPSGNWKRMRGLLLDHLNHEIDLLTFLFGPSGFRAMKVHDSFDHYHATGLRTDGIAFSFEGTRRLEEKRYPEYVSVRFERGSLLLDAEHGTVTAYHHGTGTVFYLTAGQTDYAERFRKTTANFFLSILGNDRNYLTPEDLWVNNATAVHLTERGEWTYVQS